MFLLVAFKYSHSQRSEREKMHIKTSSIRRFNLKVMKLVPIPGKSLQIFLLH